jgi:serralysin
MAAVAAAPVGSAGADVPPAGAHAGPPYNFNVSLTGDGWLPFGLKDKAMILKTALGYRFRTGQQDSHLVVTVVDGGLRFADRGTKQIIKLAPGCHRRNAHVGIAAVCRVPEATSANSPMLIEVWPRLGNDFTDSSSLPASFAVTVLGDKGHDVAHFGAGWDFFNGFTGHDDVRGGAGNDWLRTDIGDEKVYGGPGNDDIVAGEGRDSFHGGDGRDRIWGADGNDRMWGDAGADFLMCGNGQDSAHADSADRVAGSCEAVATG